MVLQQCAQVLGLLAGNGVETIVRHRDRPVAVPAEQFLDLGRPFPHDDRLGSIGGAQRIDQPDERGIGRSATEKPVEVVAKGAACAQLAAMVTSFYIATFAVEVVGDRGARRADRVPVGVRRARQQPVLVTLGAGAPSVNGVEVADVA